LRMLCIMARADSPLWLKVSYSRCAVSTMALCSWSAWFSQARRALHSSVPCRTVDWGYFRQAVSDARDRCECMYCLLLGTIILLLTVEGDLELAYDWITASFSCFGRRVKGA
jgi:hypothetical protein